MEKTVDTSVVGVYSIVICHLAVGFLQTANLQLNTSLTSLTSNPEDTEATYSLNEHTEPRSANTTLGLTEHYEHKFANVMLLVLYDSKAN